MQHIHKLSTPCLSIVLSVVLVACGGGGTGSAGGSDINPTVAIPVAATTGPDNFLLFPNPIKQNDGSLQVNTLKYAVAYYQAIDPGNERDSLAKFKTKNGFGDTANGAIEESITIGDQRDLGYGRKMTGRQNPDGTLAFVVENYLVGGYGAYSSFDLEAAIKGEPKWHLGTNGIEFSPGPGGTVSFVKFYTFDPVTGGRLLMGNLDGRGDKAMPTVCMSCHGGRGDGLTPTGLFPRLMNVASSVDVHTPDRGGMRGDLAGQLHAFEPAAFDFSTLPGYTRDALEGKIKTLNKMVLCSTNLPTGTSKPTGYAEDNCRRVANPNEYQGTSAKHLKNIYGGNGLPAQTSAMLDSYVPPTWQSNGQSSLYLNTVTQSCRVCHSVRGTGNQSSIDFERFNDFDAYAPRIKAHIVDRGNMPLAKLVYDNYWSTPSINRPMSDYLANKGFADAASRAGRPVADPGPARVVKSLSTALDGSMSLYSTGYQWTISAGPGGATLSGAATMTPTFTAVSDGVYTLQLVTSASGVSSSAQSTTLVVDRNLPWNPTAVSFSDIKSILQTGPGNCTTCHTTARNPQTQIQTPPVFYNDYDRALTGDPSDATNRQWLYEEVRSRANFTDVVASPILRKPAGHQHGGGSIALNGFNTDLQPGDPGRQGYDKILAWILNGAPE